MAGLLCRFVFALRHRFQTIIKPLRAPRLTGRPFGAAIAIANADIQAITARNKILVESHELAELVGNIKIDHGRVATRIEFDFRLHRPHLLELIGQQWQTKAGDLGVHQRERRDGHEQGEDGGLQTFHGAVLSP